MPQKRIGALYNGKSLPGHLFAFTTTSIGGAFIGKDERVHFHDSKKTYDLKTYRSSKFVMEGKYVLDIDLIFATKRTQRYWTQKETFEFPGRFRPRQCQTKPIVVDIKEPNKPLE